MVMSESEANIFALKALRFLVYECKFRPKKPGILYFYKDADEDERFTYYNPPRSLNDACFANLSLKEKPLHVPIQLSTRERHPRSLERWSFNIIPKKQEVKGWLSWLFDEPSMEKKVDLQVKHEIDMAYNYYDNPKLAREIQNNSEFRYFIRQNIIMKELKEDFTICDGSLLQCYLG